MTCARRVFPLLRLANAHLFICKTLIGTTRFYPNARHGALLSHLPLFLRNIQGVRHLRLWSGRPPPALAEVILDQRAERAVLEEPRAPGHRRFDDFIADLFEQQTDVASVDPHMLKVVGQHVGGREGGKKSCSDDRRVAKNSRYKTKSLE